MPDVLSLIAAHESDPADCVLRTRLAWAIGEHRGGAAVAHAGKVYAVDCDGHLLVRPLVFESE